MHPHPDQSGAKKDCMCDWCVDFRRRRRYNDKMRNLGKGIRVTIPQTQEAIAKLNDLKARGASYNYIREQTGLALSTISRYNRGTRTQMHRESYDKIMSLQWDPETMLHGNRRAGSTVDMTGTLRRVQGLHFLGFPFTWQSQQLGLWHRPTGGGDLISQWIRGDIRYVSYKSMLDVKRMYEKYECADPAELGIPTQVIARTRAFALSRGYVHPGYWDTDTIDNPAAFPDYTGACGTVLGHIRHYKARERICEPCKIAMRAHQRSRNASKT